MKAVMEDDKYKDLDLVEVASGDDEPQKSTDQTQALISKYPDLKVILLPDYCWYQRGGRSYSGQRSLLLKLQALDFLSEMSAYIGDDDSSPCPYMFLWNPGRCRKTFCIHSYRTC